MLIGSPKTFAAIDNSVPPLGSRGGSDCGLPVYEPNDRRATPVVTATFAEGFELVTLGQVTEASVPVLGSTCTSIPRLMLALTLASEPSRPSSRLMVEVTAEGS